MLASVGCVSVSSGPPAPGADQVFTWVLLYDLDQCISYIVNTVVLFRAVHSPHLSHHRRRHTKMSVEYTTSRRETAVRCAQQKGHDSEDQSILNLTSPPDEALVVASG